MVAGREQPLPVRRVEQGHAPRCLTAAAQHGITSNVGLTIEAVQYFTRGERSGDGVFAPNHRLRKQVAPARRGGRKAAATDEPAPGHHVGMTWAQRLMRVFKLDITTCTHCGGAVKVIACIEDPAVIKNILRPLDRHAAPAIPSSDQSPAHRRNPDYWP